MGIECLERMTIGNPSPWMWKIECLGTMTIEKTQRTEPPDLQQKPRINDLPMRPCGTTLKRQNVRKNEERRNTTSCNGTRSWFRTNLRTTLHRMMKTHGTD